jgi:tetratricopeptide (TPR) repeat protein
MNQEELMAKIDRYDWQLMPESERQLMEKEMSENPDFRDQVIQRQLENTAIKQLRQQALQAKMKTWQAESEAETTNEIRERDVVEGGGEAPPKIVPLSPLRVLRFTPMQWAAAASLALLVVFGGNYWVKNNYGNAALVAEFSPKSGELLRGTVGLGAGTTTETDAIYFDQGNKAMGLETPDYKAAVENYTKLVGDDYKIQAQMALAEAYFQLKEYGKAISIYQDVLAAKKLETNILQQAEIKLAITYLAENKPQNTAALTRILGDITKNPSHPFYQVALDLNQKINSFWWRLAN